MPMIMDASDIKSRAKQYFAKAASWTAMVIATAIAVILIGHFFFPRAIELIEPPMSAKGNVSGGETYQYGIKEIIRAVRKEIVATQDTLVANEEEALFQLETFDIELSFVVAQGAKASANVDVPQFLVVGADTEYKKEQIQKIMLHLRVVDPPPSSQEIVDEVLNKDEAINPN